MTAMKRFLPIALTMMLLAAAASLCFSVPVRAGSDALHLSAESIDPVADSLALLKYRSKMDSIKVCRPTVALVLSGGGAKGAAHVGVLKYLEEQDIPIDFIVGTSMGGLVGGLYALGYKSGDIRTIFTTADWDELLADELDNSHISYSDNMYFNKFAFSMPFKYRKRDFKSEKSGSGVRLGAGNDRLLSSLPSGYVSGLNVYEIFSSRSVGYQSDIDFSEMPIPFMCVASDLVSGKAKNWTSGSLILALRSTMSIPGLFDPVRTDGMILMDGGTRNNFPTDIAIATGADIIIGVDLSDRGKDYEEVNNIADIVMQAVGMLGQPAFDKNVDRTDIFIKPNLDGYNMLSFSEKNIEIMMERGYEAAKGVSGQLAGVRTLMAGRKHSLQSPAAIDVHNERLRLSGIRFEGILDEEAEYLMKRIPIKAGDSVGAGELKTALHRLYATGAFKDIMYELLEDGSGYELCFHCTKGPIHRFGMGARVDTQDFVALCVNFGLYAYKLTGSKLDITLRLGKNFGATVRYAYDTPFLPTFNAEISGYRPQFSFNSLGDGYSVSMCNLGAKLYLSNMTTRIFDWKVGVRYDYNKFYNVWTNAAVNAATNPDVDRHKESKASVFVEGGAYTMDNKAFPTRGVDFRVGYRWAFAGAEPLYQGNFHAADINVRAAFGGDSRFAFLLNFDTRMLFSSGTPSTVDCNYAGGDMRGRYFEQQLPLLGILNPVAFDKVFSSLTLEPRVRVWKKFYASLPAGIFKDAATLGEQITVMDGICAQAGVRVGYDAFFGPLMIETGWNSLMTQWTVSASVGFEL